MNCKVCGNTSTKNASISFFRFPKENSKCRDWAERCDLLSLLEKHGTMRFYKSFRICSNHFKAKDIVFDGRKKRLLPSAIPQILVFDEHPEEKKVKNFKNINYDEIIKIKMTENVCRLCAEEEINLTDVYGNEGRTLNLEKKLKLLPLSINKFDNLPLRVCYQCILKVNQFHDFVVNCIKAETKLRIMLDLEVYKPSSIYLSCNDECQNSDVSNLKEKSLIKTPNLNTPIEVNNFSNQMTCFQENNSYIQVLQDNFINADESCCLSQSLPCLIETNQLINDTNFIKGDKLRENNSCGYDYSNVISREQPQTEPKTCIENEDNAKNSCDVYLDSFCCTKPPKSHSINEQSDLNAKLFCKTYNKEFTGRFELDKPDSQWSEESCMCKICDKKFYESAFLEKHASHHLENSVDFSTNLRPSNIFNNFHKKSRLKYFLKRNQNKSSFISKFKTRNPTLETTSIKSEKPRCHFCDRFLKNCQVCRIQEKTHSEEIPHQCKQCGKTFSSKPSLRQHSSVHSDMRLYNCNECGGSFKRKDTLNNHLRIHTGERPFVCKLCGFAFKQRGDCIKHEKNHQKT